MFQPLVCQLYFNFVCQFCVDFMWHKWDSTVLHNSTLFLSIMLYSVISLTLSSSIMLYSTSLLYSFPLYSFYSSTQTCANRRRRESSRCRFSLCCWSWCPCCCTLRFLSWILVLSCLMTVTCRSVYIGILQFFGHPDSCDVKYLLEVPPAILS